MCYFEFRSRKHGDALISLLKRLLLLKICKKEKKMMIYILKYTESLNIVMAVEAVEAYSTATTVHSKPNVFYRESYFQLFIIIIDSC